MIFMDLTEKKETKCRQTDLHVLAGYAGCGKYLTRFVKVLERAKGKEYEMEVKEEMWKLGVHDMLNHI